MTPNAIWLDRHMDQWIEKHVSLSEQAETRRLLLEFRGIHPDAALEHSYPEQLDWMREIIRRRTNVL